MADKHNSIYSILVHDETDLAGAIAYSMYKRHKIEWIEQTKIENNGHEPTKEQLADFHRLSLLPSSIESYQEKADRFLGGFLSISLENAIEQVKEHNKQEIYNELTRLLKSTQDELQLVKTEVAKRKSYGQLAIDAIISVVGTIIVIILVGFLLQGYRWISSFNIAS